MTSPPKDASREAKDGFTLAGHLANDEVQLLSSVYAESLVRLEAEWSAQRAKGEIFWVNLWQRSGGAPPWPLERARELDAWARAIQARLYDESVLLDGYGFSINPPGSRTQPWHLDYAVDYSSVFIPLTPLTTNNAPQYIVVLGSPSPEAYERAIRNPDVVDVDALVEGAGAVSVRQLLAKPYSLLKLDFGTIHRGIANSEPTERVMFWLSFRRSNDELPVESLMMTI